MKLLNITVLAALLGCSTTALAWHDHNATSEKAGSATASASALSSGEIKKVDKEAGKLTIKHGPIANLDMAPMTMVFRVKDAAMLSAVKAGDKVNFVAERAEGAITVTRIEAAK